MLPFFHSESYTRRVWRHFSSAASKLSRASIIRLRRSGSRRNFVPSSCSRTVPAISAREAVRQYSRSLSRSSRRDRVTFSPSKAEIRSSEARSQPSSR